MNKNITNITNFIFLIIPNFIDLLIKIFQTAEARLIDKRKKKKEFKPSKTDLSLN